MRKILKTEEEKVEVDDFSRVENIIQLIRSKLDSIVSLPTVIVENFLDWKKAPKKEQIARVVMSKKRYEDLRSYELKDYGILIGGKLPLIGVVLLVQNLVVQASPYIESVEVQAVPELVNYEVFQVLIFLLQFSPKAIGIMLFLLERTFISEPYKSARQIGPYQDKEAREKLEAELTEAGKIWTTKLCAILRAEPKNYPTES